MSYLEGYHYHWCDHCHRYWACRDDCAVMTTDKCVTEACPLQVGAPLPCWVAREQAPRKPFLDYDYDDD